MHISAFFIKRPVATTLLTVALALAGLMAFRFISVSPLPEVEFPTIAVYANWPGANPETMASAVATPLEREFGRIASVVEMTSTSYIGNTTITLQFDLDRDINAAARDVQAAINAASGELPVLPYNPWYRKINPADAPIMFLALTSNNMEISRVFDTASTIIQPRLAQVLGVGQVLMSGAANPTVRVELNPLRLNKYGISMEQVRSVLNQANANGPKGQFSDRSRSWAISTNDQLFTAGQYKPVVVVYRNGAPVRLSDVAEVRDSVEDLRVAGLYDGHPAVLQNIFREPGANIIETVDRLLAALPPLRASVPPAIHLTVAMHRKTLILASLREVESVSCFRSFWWCWWCFCSCATFGPPSFPVSRSRFRCWERSA